MKSNKESCLLCLATNKGTINFHSDTGKELNIIGILSTHFGFQPEEINKLSQNICYECWHKTESFHEFYQSVRAMYKKFETVFVKVENDQEAEAVEGEREIEHHINIIESVKIEEIEIYEENVNDNEENAKDNEENVMDNEEIAKEDEEILEIPCINSIDTETSAFESLSKKSQSRYIRAYEKFLEWKTGENIDKDCFSEAVMLEYCHVLKSKYKASSLLAEYSFLRTMIQRNHKININYPEISLLLKKSMDGYQKQDTNVFQPEEIRRFLSEAADFKYLDVKVAAIFSIYGAYRSETLTKIVVDDVSEQGSVFVIKIPDAKTKATHSFTLENEHAAYVKKYKKLRPDCSHQRFFLSYVNGKFIRHPMGKNKFLEAPKIIAKYLNLKDPENYTTYSFRRDTTQTTAKKISDDAKSGVLPVKSRERYIRTYDKFLEWKRDENIDKDCFSEKVMMQYFDLLKSTHRPNSLLNEYSMLKATIQKKHKLELNYTELATSLKINSVLSQPKTSYVFQLDGMERFFNEAEDYNHLAVKVIMIFGIYGVTTCRTLTMVLVNDVSEQGSVILVKIPETKTDAVRSFTLENEYAACVKKYKDLRPNDTPHTRFFIHYHNGGCTTQPMGVKWFLDASKTIAKFLKLKDAENYTSFSFRRKTSKRQLGMCSTNILNSYIELSVPKKRKSEEERPEEISDETNSKTESDISTNVMDTSAFELLPEKSRERYKQSYKKFFAWKTEENIDKECFSERVMLDYFNHLKTKFKPSSLRSEYSMLRTSILKNDSIDISYPKMTRFLKEISVGFEPQKFSVFQPDELQRFLSEADDIKFLAAKVIVIFGMFGASNPDDLAKLDVTKVTEQGSMIVVKAIDSKTKVICPFTLENEYAGYVQQYKKLRPADTSHTRFFVNYQKGKCTTQPIGMNKILFTAKVVANFFKHDPENYSFCSFNGMPKMKRGKRLKKVLADDEMQSSFVDSCNEEEDDQRPTEANVSNEFQSHHHPPHQLPSTSVISTFSNAFQSYVQPHLSHPYQIGITSNNDACNIPDSYR